MKTIINNDNCRGRVDALDGDTALGKLEYEIEGGRMRILHTYTFKGHEGKGVGKAHSPARARHVTNPPSTPPRPGKTATSR